MTLETAPPAADLRRLRLAEGSEYVHKKSEDWSHLLLDTHALRVTREWLATPAAYLFLGRHIEHNAGTGRGKTLALAEAYRRLAAEAVVTSASGLSREVIYLRTRDLKRLNFTERNAMLDRCSRAYGLLVDEVGKEPGGPGFRGFPREDIAQDIADMMEARGDRGRRTVVAGNLTPDQIFDRYGPRLTSRAVIRGGRKWIVQVEGPDLRDEDLIPPLPESVTEVRKEMTSEEIGTAASNALRSFGADLARSKSGRRGSERSDRDALERSMLAARLLSITERAARGGAQWARALMREAAGG